MTDNHLANMEKTLENNLLYQKTIMQQIAELEQILVQNCEKQVMGKLCLLYTFITYL